MSIESAIDEIETAIDRLDDALEIIKKAEDHEIGHDLMYIAELLKNLRSKM